jgi:AraC-like DNA-binding protein
MAIPRLHLLDATRTDASVPQRGRSRGIPPALERYEAFTSRIIRDAERGAEEIFGSHRLAVHARDTSDFMATLHAAQLRDITFGYLDYRVSVEVTCRALPPDRFIVFMPTNGAGHFEFDGELVSSSTARAFIARPGAPLKFRFEADSPHLFVCIKRALLERQLSRMLGRSLTSEIRFESTLAQFSPTSMRWLSAIQLLHEGIAHPTPLSQMETGLTSLEDYIAATLLLVQQSNYSAALRSPGRTAASRTLRRAVDYIDAHLAEEIQIADIAAAAGCSPRTLQAAFASELGTSAVVYVRDQRLRRVHDELRDGSSRIAPSIYSIAEVARSWGFTHMGRFAAAYRRRFGENPSDTLARAN